MLKDRRTIIAALLIIASFLSITHNVWAVWGEAVTGYLSQTGIQMISL